MPCSGWYEWRDEGGARSHHPEGRPLYMAGIWFESEQPLLVTLTTKANEVCTPYHHRMPVVISKVHISDWFRTGNLPINKQISLAIARQ
ncbi:SOS response-associated peptidase family protein [Photobacterium ganghwense]|uniref:SOS response-associated peptidase family protein n=1 Tax=Photobacterium ganghwense TaxID=320778 RepID=UPI001A8CBC45|nr:SOS response-associated peptidase family protein [Photobacterium ganghwense]